MTAAPEIARPGDRATVVADLLAAFMDDPVLSWVFPDRRRRHRYGGHFFVMQARRLLPGGLAWKADGGSALWAAPGRWRESPLDSLRLGLRTLPGVWPRPRVVTSGLLALEARHPREPHVYLATVGVRPERQGTGLGSALLRPGLEHADALRLPAYLESSNEGNVPLYERHGFAVIAEHVLPDVPTMWLMWRPAR